MKRVLTPYTWHGPLQKRYTFAIVSDLHNGPFEDLLPQLAGVDAILIPGDLVVRYTDGFDRAAAFLKVAPAIAPVYYSFGNHEWRMKSSRDWLDLVAQSGVHVINDRYVRLGDDLVLGGFGSAPKDRINPRIVNRLAAQKGVRLLLCHHPEWYEPYVQGHGIDLTLSGHAHGGQVQIFGHGLYAPGQGLFPKWTDGWYDGQRLLVSRGATNSAHHLPRLWNPCEVIMLTMEPEENAL